MSLTPESAVSPPSSGQLTSPTPPRRRRGLIAAGSAVALVALIGVGVAGASAAFAGGPAPTPSATASATAHSHAGLRAGPLRRELENDIRTGSDAATRAQKIAATLVDSPKLFAKLPANLQADLTALKNASGAAIATDAANVKSTALNGGYGAEVQKVAQHIQARVQSGSATPAPAS